VKLFEDFKKFAEPVIYKDFLHPDIVEKRTAWCLEFKARGNTKCQRTEYYEYIKDLIVDKHPINIDYASKEIVIEVFRDILVFAILPRYKELKKYNLE
jgi:hypothetical protein